MSDRTLELQKLVQKLAEGSESWNEWRRKNPKVQLEFDGMDLRGLDLSDCDLSEASFVGANLAYSDLRGAILIACDLTDANLCYCNLTYSKLIAANLKQANLSHANLLHANLLTAICYRTDLSNVDLRDHDLRGQDLREAILSGADLRGQDLEALNMQGAKLVKAKMENVNLSNSNLREANLTEVDLSSCTIEGVNLKGANLTNAKLQGLDLTGFNLSNSNFKGADLREANLMRANLDGAELSSAKLWQVQTKGWSIRSLNCSHASWDQRGHEFTHYAKGQFEKLFADKITFQLRYQRMLSYQDLATLPFLIEHLEASFWGCKLRIRDIRNEPGDTRVIIVVEDTGGMNPTILESSLQHGADKLQSIQISLQSERKLQFEIREALQAIKDKYWPKLLELSDVDSDAKTRRLAVLFTDLKGFSHWTEEERTERLSLFRGLLKPVLKKWEASYPNMEGDSLRATFQTVEDALHCAGMIQKVLNGAGFSLRIGLDIGEIKLTHNEITEQLDIEGDAINFAARLEALAEPGQVLVSENVRHYAIQADASFDFEEKKIALKKAVGEKQAGDLIMCYSVNRLGETL